MKISNLKKRLDAFSLHVEDLALDQGKIYGIIGPNGSGKTTLMKLLAGLMPPDSGHIDYGTFMPRDITMVFKKPYLIHDTVMRNLTYPLKLRGIQPDSGTVEHYLKIADLQNDRDQYAPGLSSGQQQKLSLIRAMIFSPKLILIDEAFSNLDMESAERFEGFILERQQTAPATYVVCAHQLSHIERLCDYAFFLYGGRVEAQGSTEEILLRPKNPLLQHYLQYAALERRERQ